MVLCFESLGFRVHLGGPNGGLWDWGPVVFGVELWPNGGF